MSDIPLEEYKRSNIGTYQELVLKQFMITINKIIAASESEQPPEWFQAEMSIRTLDSIIAFYYTEQYYKETKELRDYLNLIRYNKKEYFFTLNAWLQYIAYHLSEIPNLNIFPTIDAPSVLGNYEEYVELKEKRTKK